MGSCFMTRGSIGKVSEVMFELRVKCSQGVCHSEIGGKRDPVETFSCKGPETGGSLGCSRHRKVTVAGASKVVKAGRR